MRIDSITLYNFRCYDEITLNFLPGTNLLIGPNGAGKTTLLEGLSIALGSLFLGIRGYGSRNIRPDDIRIIGHVYSGDISFERQFPVRVLATGEVFGQTMSWERILSGPHNRTSSKEAGEIKSLTQKIDSWIREGAKDVVLPLVAYYGNGRLWQEPRDTGDELDKEAQDRLSRFMGYYLAIDPRCSPRELMKWLKRQEWIAFKEKKEPKLLNVVKQSIISCIEGATKIDFDPQREELVLSFGNGKTLPFSTLSDGQRGIAALVGDLATRAARLNPQLAENVLSMTPGVVLIDEVDLYLHPKWQRTIIKNLEKVFPRVQFICTTHSPQVIGGIEPERVINLAGHTVTQTLGLDSNSILKEVMDANERDAYATELLAKIYKYIDENKLDKANASLNDLRNHAKGSDLETSRIETIIENLRALMNE